MKKILSFILSIIIITASFPFSTFAAEPPVLTVSEQGSTEAELSWSYDGEYEGAVVERSTDGVNWENETDTGWNECYVSLTPKTVNYFRVSCYYYDDEYYYEDDSYNKKYSSYSNVVELYPDVSNIIDAWDCEADGNGKKVTVEWDIYSEYKSSVDGFLIYKSLNGSSYNYAANVPVGKAVSSSESRSRYKYTENAPNAYGYLIKYIVCPYYSYGGRNRYSVKKENAIKASYLDYDNFAVATTKKKQIKIKLKALGGSPKYRISYTRYKLKGGKYINKGSAVTQNTSYTINNDASKYGLNIDITPIWNGEEGGSVYFDTHSAMALMSGAGKVKKKTIKVINTRGKKTKTAWKFKVSAKDRKIIKKFFKKKFKKKNATRAEKALFALNWINKNVKYDYKYKSGNLSYADAIFNKKLGQCLQYNGAYAEVLNYLGYETRIIEGYRMNGATGKANVNHFWCEVKIYGKWYLCETGNYGKNGDWMYFCSRYANSSGYTKNGKPAKD